MINLSLRLILELYTKENLHKVRLLSDVNFRWLFKKSYDNHSISHEILTYRFSYKKNTLHIV